jgi:hypothetical protein
VVRYCGFFMAGTSCESWSGLRSGHSLDLREKLSLST